MKIFNLFLIVGFIIFCFVTLFKINIENLKKRKEKKNDKRIRYIDFSKKR